MTDTDLIYNPFEPGFTDDPYPVYRAMRDVEPVHESPFGVTMLTRYDDIHALLRSGMSVDSRRMGRGCSGTSSKRSTAAARPSPGRCSTATPPTTPGSAPW
ncbi:hypothetical protein GCM10027589_07400 [Actinocorallia lasiicapitis]